MVMIYLLAISLLLGLFGQGITQIVNDEITRWNLKQQINHQSVQNSWGLVDQTGSTLTVYFNVAVPAVDYTCIQLDNVTAITGVTPSVKFEVFSHDSIPSELKIYYPVNNQTSGQTNYSLTTDLQSTGYCANTTITVAAVASSFQKICLDQSFDSTITQYGQNHLTGKMTITGFTTTTPVIPISSLPFQLPSCAVEDLPNYLQFTTYFSLVSTSSVLGNQNINALLETIAEILDISITDLQYIDSVITADQLQTTIAQVNITVPISSYLNISNNPNQIYSYLKNSLIKSSIIVSNETQLSAFNLKLQQFILGDNDNLTLAETNPITFSPGFFLRDIFSNQPSNQPSSQPTSSPTDAIPADTIEFNVTLLLNNLPTIPPSISAAGKLALLAAIADVLDIPITDVEFESTETINSTSLAFTTEIILLLENGQNASQLYDYMRNLLKHSIDDGFFFKILNIEAARVGTKEFNQTNILQIVFPSSQPVQILSNNSILSIPGNDVPATVTVPSPVSIPTASPVNLPLQSPTPYPVALSSIPTVPIIATYLQYSVALWIKNVYSSSFSATDLNLLANEISSLTNLSISNIQYISSSLLTSHRRLNTQMIPDYNLQVNFSLAFTGSLYVNQNMSTIYRRTSHALLNSVTSYSFQREIQQASQGNGDSDLQIATIYAIQIGSLYVEASDTTNGNPSTTNNINDSSTSSSLMTTHILALIIGIVVAGSVALVTLIYVIYVLYQQMRLNKEILRTTHVKKTKGGKLGTISSTQDEEDDEEKEEKSADMFIVDMSQFEQELHSVMMVSHDDLRGKDRAKVPFHEEPSMDVP